MARLYDWLTDPQRNWKIFGQRLNDEFDELHGDITALGVTPYILTLLDDTDAATARATLDAAPFDALAYNGMQVNGSADVSQELGTTGATLASTTARYVVDGWQVRYAHAAGTAVFTAGQIAAASFPAALPGYNFAQRIRATTAFSSPASGDSARYTMLIEGYRASRLAWGTSSAQPLSVGFWFYAMRSGTLMFRTRNSAANRQYYTDFTVVAGWNWIAKTVPGDTSGTWLTDNGIGIVIDIYGAGKETTPATAGVWGTDLKGSTTASDGVNQYSSNNDNTLITGFVALPGIELPSSTRAPLIMRPYDEELALCKRYFYNGVPKIFGVVWGSTTDALRVGGTHPVPMRTSPTLTLTANLPVYDGTTARTISSIVANYSTTTVLELDGGLSAALTAGRPVMTYQGAGGNLNVDARL